MKTAGDVLSNLFDERFMKKAQSYSKLFDSWKDITAKNGIAAAADHSRIKELDRGILLLETDHPGWKQILQTKQSKLLNDFRMRFPQLEISGISLMLGRSEPSLQDITQMHKDSESSTEREDSLSAMKSPESENSHSLISASSVPSCLRESNFENNSSYESIEDEEFKEVLKKLGQNITEREKN